MLETNGEHNSQPKHRQVTSLPGFVTQLDVTISIEYDFELLKLTALKNPALARGDMPDDYMPDPSVWTL